MTWIPSLTFRRFRNRHTALSKVYWTHQLGADCVQNGIHSAAPSAPAVDSLPASFKRAMLPLTVSEMQTWLTEYMGRVRLHLLLVGAASLESYLQTITAHFLFACKHQTPDRRLTPIGEALGKPILGRASLPEPLRYAEHLFHVSYGSHLATWDRSYKLRCALAHNGGVVTAKTLREIPDLVAHMLHTPLQIKWAELHSALDAADQIATITDRKVSTTQLRETEAIAEVLRVKEEGRLPPRAKFWAFMFEEYRMRFQSKEVKARLEQLAYRG